jgi:hypothetical protein
MNEKSYNFNKIDTIFKLSLQFKIIINLESSQFQL